MGMQLVCTSKNIWAELSYGFGPSCLINLGRVGKGRVLCGPSWHGPSWFWAELSVIRCWSPNESPLLLFVFDLSAMHIIIIKIHVRLHDNTNQTPFH